MTQFWATLYIVLLCTTVLTTVAAGVSNTTRIPCTSASMCPSRLSACVNGFCDCQDGYQLVGAFCCTMLPYTTTTSTTTTTTTAAAAAAVVPIAAATVV